MIYHLFVESGWESHNNIIIKLKWLDSRCPILLLLHLLLSSWMFLDCYFMSQKPDTFWEVYSQRALQSSTDQHFKTVIHLLDSYGQHKAGGWSWFRRAGLEWDVIYITDSTNLVWTSSAESPSCSGSKLATFACWVVVTVIQVWTLNIYEKKKKKTKERKKGRYCGMKLARPDQSFHPIGGGSVTLFSLHVFLHPVVSSLCERCKMNTKRNPIGLSSRANNSTRLSLSTILSVFRVSLRTGSCDHVRNFLGCSARHNGNLGIQSRPGRSNLFELETIQSDWQEKKKKKT